MRPSRRLIPSLVLSFASLAFVPEITAQWASDPWLEDPVDDATFESWRPFFSYDVQLPFDLEVRSVKQEGGIRTERLAYASTPGDIVTAAYYTATTTRGDRPHLILVHGGTGAGKDSPAIYVAAELLVRRGFGVIAIDLPYFGERDTGLLGSFSEAEKHQALYNRESIYLEWVLQVVKDIGRTIDLLQERYDADPDRIGYVGYSRGGQVGYIVAGADDRIRAAALLYAGHFDRSETGHLAAACPANYAGRISPRSLWLLNGTFDGDYDREKSVEPLHRLAGQAAEVRWLETGHELPSQSELERMADWLAARLD